MIPIHFYDLDSTLWDTHSKEVIIDKRSPNKIIVRLTNIQSFQAKNLNKEHKLVINYNGQTRYLDPTLWKRIKELSKDITLDDLGVSEREFTEKEFLDKQSKHLTVFTNVLKSISGKALVGIITARSKQKEHSELINKLKETVKAKSGLEISKIYFVNDHNNTDPDVTAFRKTKILLEHLIGYKIKDDSFTDLKTTEANLVYFYDDIEKNIDAAKSINTLLMKVYHNSQKNIQAVVYKRVLDSDLKLVTNKITNNKLNPFVKFETLLKLPA